MTPSDVTVVIPTINEATRIGEAISSAWRASAGEVIVCDGGSADETCGISREMGASVVRSRPGRGIQLRAGAEQAGGSLLLFLHADNRLHPSCLEQVCEKASRRPATGYWGGFRQTIHSPRRVFRLIEHGNAARVRLRGMPFGDQGIFVTRVLYDQIGGIRDLPLMEDVQLSKSLRSIAWPVLLEGPIHVDPRRWNRRGVVRQTLENWGIQLAHACGVNEERLARWYGWDQSNAASNGSDDR